MLEAADVMDEMYGGGQGPAVALARDLADAIGDSAVVVTAGEGLGMAAAMRWKSQLNENAKVLAMASEIPEADHNEIEAGPAHPSALTSRVATVWLHDPAGHPQVDRRMHLTRDVKEHTFGVAGQVMARGVSPLARAWSLILVGDLVSVFVAERNGMDLDRVPVIEDLKRRLSEES
jgi:glucose/mannose-6-phosphate isomerase